MTCSQSLHLAVAPSRRRNFIASLLSFAAVGVIYFHFAPVHAGGKAERDNSQHSSLMAATPTVALPSDDPASARNDALPAVVDEAAADDDQASEAVLRGRLALLMNLLMLEKGQRELSQMPGYTATLIKQEAVGGVMADEQVLNMKLRHEPFSVYLKWKVGDRGREVLYVEGENNGDLLVKAGGLKGRLLPAVKLNPYGAVALSHSRHPVTEIGLLNLATRLIRHHRDDFEKYKDGVDCVMLDDQTLDGRPCFCFIVTFTSPEMNETYRKSIQFIDQQWSLPVCIKNYGWPMESEDMTEEELDARTLIESYCYRDVQLNPQLADADFDRGNRQYRFRR